MEYDDEPITCTKCNKTKPAKDFPLSYAKYKGKNYRRKQCQKCRNAYGLKMYHRPDYNAKIRAKDRKRYRNDPERRKQIQQASKRYYQNLRKEVLEGYGNKCQCCGETTSEFLSIDHINGGGNKERRNKNWHGWNYYKWLRDNDFPDGYQILCHNCNMAKGFYGQCPHKKATSKAMS